MSDTASTAAEEWTNVEDGTVLNYMRVLEHVLQVLVVYHFYPPRLF